MPINFRIFGVVLHGTVSLFCVCFLGKNHNQWKCTDSHFVHSSCSSFVWHLFLLMSILGTDFLVSECLLLHIIKRSSCSGDRGGSGYGEDWAGVPCFSFISPGPFIFSLLLSSLTVTAPKSNILFSSPHQQRFLMLLASVPLTFTHPPYSSVSQFSLCL